MSSPDDWKSFDKLKKLLAYRLVYQRISLFLGAGASAGFGLPDWKVLVDNLYSNSGATRPASPDNTRDAEDLLMGTKYAGDRIKFASAVRTALYQKTDLHPSNMETNRLLSAIAALVMSSVRGHVANVVTFNFDDILETYLKWRGFAVESVDCLPAWNGAADVRVLHPHGLLPIDTTSAIRRGVVFTQLDFDKIVGDAKNQWFQRITDIMRSTTCIFIGISGDDANLTNMLAQVNDSHASSGTEPYWGVRFGRPGDANETRWTNRGVHPIALDYAKTPEVLLEICQLASKIRMAA